MIFYLFMFTWFISNQVDRFINWINRNFQGASYRNYHRY